jgi:1-acyl-sn-glycerol-3-phosphate acyltransferase
MWLLLVATLPLSVLVAAAVDGWRGDGRWVTVRFLAFALLYFSCEIVGIVTALVLWLAGGWAGIGAAPTPSARLTGRAERYLRANFRLQCWWARTLFHGAERIFGMRTTIAGDDAVREGPFLLFLRHASIGDTVVPAVFIGDRHGIMLRYVMKRELLWDPCLDIVGNRLPNYFVQRGSDDGDREIAAVQHLLDDLGPRDGVLLFPEGTRFSVAKRDRFVDRLRGVAAPRVFAIAEHLRHTLPPRLGGALGLLDANPGLDAVFCAHTGFEGAATFSDLIGGALVDRDVRVAFWRVPYPQIPLDREARAEWLYEHWQRIDDWIGVVTDPGHAPAHRGAATA